jgi:hypothetical protein
MIAHLYNSDHGPHAPDPTPHHAGELAYADTFSGLVPVKVTRVHVQQSGIPGLSHVMVDVRVTADRPGWKRGDTETLGSLWVVPRGSVRRGRIRNDYVWRVTP